MMAKRYNAEKAAGLLREPSRWVLGPNRRPMLLPPRTKPVETANFVEALEPVPEVQVENRDFRNTTSAALPIVEQGHTFSSFSGARDHVSQGYSSKPSTAPARSMTDLQSLDIHPREPHIASSNALPRPSSVRQLSSPGSQRSLGSKQGTLRNSQRSKPEANFEVMTAKHMLTETKRSFSLETSILGSKFSPAHKITRRMD